MTARTALVVLFLGFRAPALWAAGRAPARLTAPQLAVRLAPALRSPGYAAVPAEGLLGAKGVGELRAVMARAGTDLGLFQARGGGWSPRLDERDPRGVVRRLESLWTGALQSAFPDEAFRLEYIATVDYGQPGSSFVNRDGSLYNNHLHVDFSNLYFVTNLSFDAPGTWMYSLDGGLSTERIPEGVLGVMTAAERQRAAGYKAVVHTAPPGIFPRRRSLFIGHTPVGSRAPADPDAEQDIEWRVARVRALLGL